VHNDTVTSLAGLSVLVIEDEAMLRRRIAAHIEALGADVTGAESLAAARQLLLDLDFDFALLDINLPDDCTQRVHLPSIAVLLRRTSHPLEAETAPVGFGRERRCQQRLAHRRAHAPTQPRCHA